MELSSSSFAEPDNNERRIPIPNSSLYTILPTPTSGLGVFATQPLAPKTLILTSLRPFATVVFRAFRKEVCAWCFKYDRGRQWKIKYTAAGMYFCSELCLNEWSGAIGSVGKEALESLERLIVRKIKQVSQDDTDTLQGITVPPTEEEILNSWSSVQHRASGIRAARTSSSLSKQQKKTIASTLQLNLPADDDLLPFVLSGLISHLNSPSQWPALLNISPHLRPYASKSALEDALNAYLVLLAVMPVKLLSSITPENIHAIISRDTCNSFGIWSCDTRANVDDTTNLTDSVTSPSRDGGEFLGYALYPASSFFNHSCSPTLTKRRSGACWLFETPLDRMLDAGEELCISYLGGEEETLGREKRREKLKKGWYFDCACAKCLSEAECDR